MGSFSQSEKHGLPDITSEDEGYGSEVAYSPQHMTVKEKGFGMPEYNDLESQKTLKGTVSGKHAAEYSVPATTKYSYLGLYFGLNLGLTLFNKAVLGKV